MFGANQSFFKDAVKTECDTKTLIAWSGIASMADGAVVAGALAAAGKSATVAIGAGATACGASTLIMLGCGLLFCHAKDEPVDEAEPLLDEDAPRGAIDFTPHSRCQ